MQNTAYRDLTNKETTQIKIPNMEPQQKEQMFRGTEGSQIG